ncbi:beige protein-like 1 [Tilletia horrida]|nr:beige protein-like 1 [Tilletia horrida]
MAAAAVAGDGGDELRALLLLPLAEAHAATVRITELAQAVLQQSNTHDRDDTLRRVFFTRRNGGSSFGSEDVLAGLAAVIGRLALELDQAVQDDTSLSTLLALAAAAADIGGISSASLRALLRTLRALLNNALGQTLLASVNAPPKPRTAGIGRAATTGGAGGRSASGSHAIGAGAANSPRRRKTSQAAVTPRHSTAAENLDSGAGAAPASPSPVALALPTSSPRITTLSLSGAPTPIAPALLQQQARRKAAYRRAQLLLQLLVDTGRSARPPSSPAPATHWSKGPHGLANDLLTEGRLPNATHVRLLGGGQGSGKTEQILSVPSLACPWDTIDPAAGLRFPNVGPSAGVGFTIVLTFQLEDLEPPKGDQPYTEVVNLVQLSEAGSSPVGTHGPPLVGLALSIIRRPGSDAPTLMQMHYTSTSFAFAQPSARSGRMPPAASTTVVFGIGGGVGPSAAAEGGSPAAQTSSSRPLVLRPNRTYSLMLAHAAPPLTPSSSPSPQDPSASGAASLPSLDMRTPVSLYIDGELIDVRRSVWPRTRPGSRSSVSGSPSQSSPSPSGRGEGAWGMVKAEFGGTPAVSPLPPRQLTAPTPAPAASGSSAPTSSEPAPAPTPTPAKQQSGPTWALKLFTPLYILRTHLPTSPLPSVGAGADTAFLVHQLLLPSAYKAHGYTHEPVRAGANQSGSTGSGGGSGGSSNASSAGLGRFLTYAGSMRVNLRLDERHLPVPALLLSGPQGAGGGANPEAQRHAEVMAEHALRERRRRLVRAVAGSSSDTGASGTGSDGDAGGNSSARGGGSGMSPSESFPSPSLAFSLVAGKARERAASNRDRMSPALLAWTRDALDFWGERNYGMYLSLDFDAPFYSGGETGQKDAMPGFNNRTSGWAGGAGGGAEQPRRSAFATIVLRRAPNASVEEDSSAKAAQQGETSFKADPLQPHRSLADAAHLLGATPALLDMLRLASWAESASRPASQDGATPAESPSVDTAPVFVHLLELILLIIGGETSWRTSEEAERSGAWEVLKLVLERNARVMMSLQAALAEGVPDRIRGWAADDACAAGVLRVLFEAAGRRYVSTTSAVSGLPTTSSNSSALDAADQRPDDSNWALVNPLLYRLILLDVRVFKFCRSHIRQAHLSHFSALLRESSYRAFNIRRISKMGILRRLLSAWNSHVFDSPNELGPIHSGLGLIGAAGPMGSSASKNPSADVTDDVLLALRTLLKTNFSESAARVLTSYLTTQLGRPRRKGKALPFRTPGAPPEPPSSVLSSSSTTSGSSLTLPASLLITLTGMARERAGLLDKLSTSVDIRWLIPIFADWNSTKRISGALDAGLDSGRRIVSSSSLQSGLNLHAPAGKGSDSPAGTPGHSVHFPSSSVAATAPLDLDEISADERREVVGAALQLLVLLCGNENRRRSSRHSGIDAPAQRNYSDRFNAAGGFRVLERYLPFQWNAPTTLPLCWAMLFGLAQVPAVLPPDAAAEGEKAQHASAPATRSGFIVPRLPTSEARAGAGGGAGAQPDEVLLDHFGPSRYVLIKNVRALRLIVACWRQGLLELARKEEAKRKYSNLLVSGKDDGLPKRPQHLRRRSRSVNFDAREALQDSDERLLEATVTLLEQHCDREALREEFRELLFTPNVLRGIVDAIVPMAHALQKPSAGTFAFPGSSATRLASRMLELLARLATESMAATGSMAIVDALLGAVPPMDLTQQSAFRSTLLDAVLRHVARASAVDLTTGKAVPGRMLPSPTALHAFVTFIARSSEEFLSGLTVSVPILLNLLAGLFDQLRSDERRATDLFAALKQHARVRALLLISMNRVFLCRLASSADRHSTLKSILDHQEWLLGPENSDNAFIECVLNRVYYELKRSTSADDKKLSFEVLCAFTLARPPLAESALLPGKTAADVLQSGPDDVFNMLAISLDGDETDELPYQDAWTAFIKSNEALRAAAHFDRVARVKQLMDSSDSRQRSVQGTEAKLRNWHAKLCESEMAKTARSEQDAREISRYATKQQQEMFSDLQRSNSILFEEETGRVEQMALDPTEGPRRMRKKLHPLRAGVEDELEPAVPQGHHSRGASASAGEDQQSSPLSHKMELPPGHASDGRGAAGNDDEEGEEDDGTLDEDVNIVDEDEDDDKFRRVLRALDRGDIIEDVYNTSRVVSIECRGTLAIIGRSKLYLLDDYFQRPNGELVDAWEAPAEERDAFVLATLASNAEQRSALVTQLDGEAQTRKWSWHDVDACFRRTWLHRKTALELFFRDGQSTDLANRLHAEIRIRAPRAVQAADGAMDSIRELAAPSPGPSGFKARLADAAANALRGRSQAGGALTQAWVERKISNFEYLMTLNSLSGRTYNDCTQYPVMPWVVADYTSDELDLTKPSTFRNLALPMGAQSAARRAEVEERYEQLLEMSEDGDAAFHYGTHYSTAAVVCAYLVRVRPFDRILIALQGGTFDLADRTFSSIAKAWASASELSRGDVRELTPEFFYLPELLVNTNRFDFGTTQAGQVINNVELPPWAKGDPLRFIKLHREALESDYVSANLHLWIDLIFGWRSRGPAAVEATNCFHPLSYETGINLETIESSLERQAAAQAIHNFGQTPQQLFSRPHPARMPRVEPRQAMFSIEDHPWLLIESFAPLQDTRARIKLIAPTQHGVQGFPLLSTPISNGTMQVSINRDDERLVVSPLSRPGDDGGLPHWPPTVVECITSSLITCVASAGQGAIALGAADGLVTMLWLDDRTGQVSVRGMLRGHQSLVHSICASTAWSIIVTGGSDGSIMVWDLNRIEHVRTLPTKGSHVEHIAIDDHHGYIATLSASELRLWTINGELLAEQAVEELALGFPTALAFLGADLHSSGRLAVLLTGHEGKVASWECVLDDQADRTSCRWKLRQHYVFEHRDRYGALQHTEAITAISASKTRMLTGDAQGRLYQWSLPASGDQANLQINTEALMGGCCAECEKRFGVLEVRRTCAGCAGTFCGACAAVESAGLVRGHRFCSHCKNILRTLPLEP